MTDQTITTIIVAVASISSVYLLLSAGGPFLSGAKDKVAAWFKGPSQKSNMPPVEAAAYFSALRSHFVSTEQPGRVSVMDDDLAAGVFSTEEAPVSDITGGQE